MSWRFTTTLLLLLLGGCGPQAADGNAAMVEELRSLRRTLAPQPVDSRTLAQALEPLNETLRSLAREQASAQQRQQAMAEELSRWAMFLSMGGRGAPMPTWPPATGPVPGVGVAATQGAEPVVSTQDPVLMARLAELERQLLGSAQRQRDVEAVVERSLDGTAAHVDKILLQLQALAAAGALLPEPRPVAEPHDAAMRAAGTTVPDLPRGPGDSGSAAVEGGPADGAAETAAREFAANADQRDDSFLRGRAQLHQFWLIVVLTVGLGAIGLLAWRLRQRPAPRPLPAAEAAGDMTTDELWAAAGLLSEAVGRLRSAVPLPTTGDKTAAEAAAIEVAGLAEPAAEADATAAPPAAGSPAPDLEVDRHAAAVGSDDVFVLDDERNLLADVDWGKVAAHDDAAAPTSSAPATPAEESAAPTNGHHGVAEPPRWTIQLDSADHVLARATVDAYLHHDPRVLRLPAPIVRANDHGIEVQLALLPGLLAGEREHLRATLQRLLKQA